MSGFNDGIEAAANHIRHQLQHAAPDQGVILSGLIYEIEDLKRPEPSEGERVDKVAAAIERELMIDERLLADPATLRKIKSQRIARAALKAMEQGQ